MNEFDSERIEFILKHSGYLKVNQPQRADIIIFNTCSVRKKAEDRMYGHIGNLKSMKAENPQILICVGGCTAQSLGEKILKDLPHVDIVFGTRCIDRLPELRNKGILRQFVSGDLPPNERQEIWELFKKTTGPCQGQHPSSPAFPT